MNEKSMTIIPEFLKEIVLMTFTSKHENCILGSSLKRQHTDNGRFLEFQTYRRNPSVPALSSGFQK